MIHVEQLAQRPHPTGSADHARVRQYIISEIEKLGLTPHVQEVTGVGTRYPVAGRVRNIVVRAPGSQPGGLAVLLMAHYDGVPASPAAGDDASGTAVLLETLRALRASPALAQDVVALFTDSEESGLLGAAAFAREHDWANDVGVILNFEARGTGGPSLMFETGEGNLDVVRVLRRIGGTRATSLSTTVYRQLPNDTDLSEMMRLGRPAMNFAFIGGVERYHTSQDDVEHLDARSVQDHGDQALALAREFGNGPLPRPRSTDAVFFDFPLVGLIVYPQRVALPIAVGTLALLISAVVLLRNRETAWLKDISLGALATVLSVALAGGLGLGAAMLVSKLHAALSNGGAPQWSLIYAAAIALLALATVAAFMAMSRRAASAGGVAVGALVVLSALALYLSIAQPGVSYLFVWPVMFATIAAIAAAYSTRRVAAVRLLGWLAATVVIMLVAPTLYLMVCVALGLDAAGGAVMGVLTAMGAWLLAPHLESLMTDAPWRPALVMGATSIALFVLGGLTVRTSTRHPSGATLVYAIDADSLTGWIAGSGATTGVRRSLEAALPRSPNVRIESPRWMQRLYDPRRIAPAPVVAFDPPMASLMSDSSSASQRIVTLRIRAGKGARAIGLSAESGIVLDATVDGRPVDRSEYHAQFPGWRLEYVAPPDSGFVLRVSIRPEGAAVIAMTGRHDGIPPGISVPARPQGVIPVQSGDMTLVYKRVRL